jgi:hypothetical protein
VFAAVVAAATLARETAATADEPTKEQCMTANEAAQPLRRSGKLRDARTQLLVCISQVCPALVRNDCTQRLDEVQKALPTVVLVLKGDDDKDLTAVRVTLDGAPFAEHLDGTALPVDPGEHTFVFEADGYVRAEKPVVLREGDREQRVNIVLQTVAKPAPVPVPPPIEVPPPKPPETTPPVATEPASAQSPPPPTYGAHQSSSWSGQKTWAIVLGAGGVIGLGVGSVFGIMANASKSSQISACPSSQACTQSGYAQALTDHNDATNAANDSTLFFGLGAAAIVTAIVVWATAPAAPKPRPSSAWIVPMLGPLAGATLQGAF